MDFGTIIQLATLVATGGAAYGGVKVGLNGMRERTKNIEHKLDRHVVDSANKHTAVVDRISNVEAKVDSIQR